MAREMPYIARKDFKRGSVSEEPPKFPRQCLKFLKFRNYRNASRISGIIHPSLLRGAARRRDPARQPAERGGAAVPPAAHPVARHGGAPARAGYFVIGSLMNCQREPRDGR